MHPLLVLFALGFALSVSAHENLTRFLCQPAAALATVPSRSSNGPYPFDPTIYPRYDMEVSVSDKRDAIDVRGEVSVPTSILDAREDLLIALSDRVQKLSIAAIDARGNASAVTATAIADAAVPGELRRWQLSFDGQRPFGLNVRLRFSYHMPGSPSTIYAITPQAAFAGGVATVWYPQVVSTSNVRRLGLGELKIRVPRDFIVVDAERDGTGAFRILFEHPSYFDFVAGPYRVERSRSGRALMYLLRPHPEAAEFPARLDDSISALVEEFGAFPQKRFHLVEVPTAVGRSAGFDGASLEGCILAIESYFDQPFNTAFFGHELAHQWWGTLVRRHGPGGAYLLDEALAQFGSLRAVEKVDGPVAARQYRLDGSPGYYAEYSGFGYLSRSLEGIDAPLANLPSKDGFIARRVANTKGMMVWDTLAREFGRERFADFLSRFAADNAYDRVTLDDFMAALRQFAGERTALVTQWFEWTGVPDIRLSWQREDAGVRVLLQQEGRAFDLTVPLEIRLANGQNRRINLRLAQPRLEEVLPVNGQVVDVVLDPDYEILRWTEAFREKARAVAPSTRGDIKLHYGKDEEAQAEFEAAFRSVPAGKDRFALRFRLLRGLGDAASGQNKWDLAIARYCEAARLGVRAEEQIPELWQGLSEAWLRKGDKARAKQAAEDAAASVRQLKGGNPTTFSSAERREACRGIASRPL